MSDPVYYDFDKEMSQIALFLQADSDLLADKLSLRIKQMMATGMSQDAIIATLRKDLYGGGSLFSGFSSTFKKSVMPTIDDVAQGAIIHQNPGAAQWEWITTSADPCDDCAPRHGVLHTYEEWRGLGLPRSGFSVCGDHCKCSLVPSVQVGRSLEDGPVNVDPLAAARADFQARLSTDSALKAKLDGYRAQARARRNSRNSD